MVQEHFFWSLVFQVHAFLFFYSRFSEDYASLRFEPIDMRFDEPRNIWIARYSAVYFTKIKSDYIFLICTNLSD